MDSSCVTYICISKGTHTKHTALTKLVREYAHSINKIHIPA
jgi:hypothetical protein